MQGWRFQRHFFKVSKYGPSNLVVLRLPSLKEPYVLHPIHPSERLINRNLDCQMFIELNNKTQKAKLFLDYPP